MPQDMPPKGGYAPIQYKRNLIPLAFKPGWWLVAVGAIMAYGWSKLIPGMHELNELGREKMWSRFYILPVLQAEEDRDQYRRWVADQERERALLGKATSAYNSDRFVKPTYATAPAREARLDVVKRKEGEGGMDWKKE